MLWLGPSSGVIRQHSPSKALIIRNQTQITGDLLRDAKDLIVSPQLQHDVIDKVTAFALVFLSKQFPIRIQPLENRMISTSFRVVVGCLGTLTLSLALIAQDAPPTPRPAPSVVAGIPVNYDDAKVGSCTLR